MPLTERRAQILRLIVDQYIRDAVPVPSAGITWRLPHSLSSATIRNEMAALEDEGFITHPHTSAGRIPRDKGYRYYVEALMQEEDITDDQKRAVRHQFHQAEHDLELWMRLAAAVVARLVSNLALVVPPRSARSALRWLEVIRLHDFLALLVMVFNETRIRQWVVPLERSYDQDELADVSKRLKNILIGLDSHGMRDLSVNFTPLEEAVRQAVMGTLEDEDISQHDPPFLDGTRQLLDQPEFFQRERLLDALDIMETRQLVEVAQLMTVASKEGVQVIIGDENAGPALRPYSIVVGRYGPAGGPQGAIGVLGPTRMAYYRTVPVVRYVATLLTDLTTYYYG